MRKAKNNHFLGYDLVMDKKWMVKGGKTKNTFPKESVLSEWPDSNGRPLAPHARMLANCTTPRIA